MFLLLPTILTYHITVGSVCKRFVFFADWNLTVNSVYYALLTSLLSWTHANDNIVHNINSNGYLWYHARHLSVVKIKEQEIELTVSYYLCNVSYATHLDVLI